MEPDSINSSYNALCTLCFVDMIARLQMKLPMFARLIIIRVFLIMIAPLQIMQAYRGILTSNWILGSYALRCGVRESMLSPPILPTDDLEERMARLANVPLAWIGMAHVCSSYDEDPIIEWTKLVILPLILDVVSFLKRATALVLGPHADP